MKLFDEVGSEIDFHDDFYKILSKFFIDHFVIGHEQFDDSDHFIHIDTFFDHGVEG